jgi:hypothetical protein
MKNKNVNHNHKGVIKMNNKPEEYKEPEWMNPANDRKTPYTEEEIEEFVEVFIERFPDHYKKLLKDDGPNTAKIILKNRFKAKDENRF